MQNENDLFYFESDHVALKGNKDYCELLKTIAILESQKLQAVKDIEKLIEIQNVAMKDPISFVEKIKNNVDIGLPFRQIIPEIPCINWAKYGVPVPEEALQLIKEGGFKREPLSIQKNKHNFSGRPNQPWTPEEQKKLEELLMKYPPEAVEMRRFKKIADELGNRTVLQVSSRVQKYFLKLYKAGLPIPGRIPKTVEKRKLHKHKRHNYLLYKPSTFFPDNDVPVRMPEDDDDTSFNFNLQTISEVPLKDDVTQKIELLKKIKVETEKSKNLPLAIHIGYKCDLCLEEPLRGCRWHCITCIENSVDYCNDCIISQINGPNPHPFFHDFIPHHTAEPITKEEIFSDNDQYETNFVLEPGMSSESVLIKEEVHLDNDSLSEDSDSFSNSNYTSEDNIRDFDQDYVTDMFATDKKYNYLDPNFLPELHRD